MDELSFVFPFPVGAYLTKVVNGKEHIDRLEEYIVNETGIYAILTLDVNKDPRKSNRISMDRLIEEWSLSEPVKIKKKFKLNWRKLK